jgi:large subunit ribosomal protein L15
LDKLQQLVDDGKIKDTVTLDVLMENRLARKNDLIKILGRGELKAKLNITVHKFSTTAKAAIEKAGGEATTI